VQRAELPDLSVAALSEVRYVLQRAGFGITTMTEDAYIFEGTADSAELERLQTLEAVFDEKSRQWLRSSGPLFGIRCLEVGAGAGSIAAWLASEVGSGGLVAAVDTNIRFLGQLPSQVQVIQGDLGEIALPADSFDLVHARYVLIHNAHAEVLLDAMLRALKPGGALVLEEPDFSAAMSLAGPSNLRNAFDNVSRAIDQTFSARGMNYAFGSALPGLVQDRAATLRSVEYDCPVASGGTNLAKMMRLSALALRDKYVGTGIATHADVDGYAEFALTPSCWANYYATVRVLAVKTQS
jgi:ubiquinone/menaquinone biosynthesis C-methylase UbiE